MGQTSLSFRIYFHFKYIYFIDKTHNIIDEIHKKIIYVRFFLTKQCKVIIYKKNIFGKVTLYHRFN